MLQRIRVIPPACPLLTGGHEPPFRLDPYSAQGFTQNATFIFISCAPPSVFLKRCVVVLTLDGSPPLSAPLWHCVVEFPACDLNLLAEIPLVSFKPFFGGFTLSLLVSNVVLFLFPRSVSEGSGTCESSSPCLCVFFSRLARLSRLSD